MADVFLTTNVGFAASDVILRPSRVVKGGTLRRHMGNSAGQPRQIQRFIRYRWHLTVTVTGQIVAPVATEPPPITATVTLGAPTRIRTHRLALAGHITTSTRPRSPGVRLLNLDEEDDLLLLLDLI